MSGSGAKFREDQVLVICPGSQTTIAQMGVAELSPPIHKFPTRMFPDPETPGDFVAYHTYKRKKPKPVGTNGANGNGNGSDAPQDEYEWVEDSDSAEGAVYPIVGGRIVHMKAFLAFLEHVHSMLTTTYHNTPILLMASPQWVRDDYETIARYVFEQTKTPSLCMLMSSIATQYGIKWPNMCVVDIGYQKVDCTAIYDYQIVNHQALGVTSQGQPTLTAGGDVFTRSLMDKLKDKDFNYDMAEQLKKSNICEVLPYSANFPPEFVDLPTEQTGQTGQTASSGHDPAATVPASEGPAIVAPAVAAEEEDGENGVPGVDADGVLDVATIVTSGQTKEFLAKKEKEKQERLKQKKLNKAQEAQDAATAKAVKLPNSRKVRNIFHYEQIIEEEVMVPVKEPAKDVPMTDAVTASPAAEQSTNGVGAGGTEAQTGDATEENKEEKQEEKPDVPTPEPVMIPERQIRKTRRDIEVGLERFTFATRAEIDRLVQLIFDTIQGSPEPYMRTQIWENIVFVGNGSRLRGLKENVMATLNARHLISPSTASIFLSDLPSNIATPSGTGSQTPMASFNTPPPQLPTASSVNPLLQAATTASLQIPLGRGQPGAADSVSNAGGEGLHRGHHSHSQTPTNIKMAPVPSYLQEWTKNGYEEAMFLGSLIGARTAFCPAHNVDKDTLECIRNMSLSRVDYNEHGPSQVHKNSMLRG